MGKRWLIALCLLGVVVAVGVAFGIGSRTSEIRYDADSGITWLVEVDQDVPHKTTWLTPAGQAALIVDEHGRRAGVSDLGALYVAQKGGTPQSGLTDAAGADTYTTLMTASKQCHYMCVTCITHGAQISIDGGATDGPALGAGSHILSGLDISAGAVIQARNAISGSNYVSLIVTIW